MNKRILFAAIALLLPAFASALSFEARAAAFFPLNQRVQKIYGKTLPLTQVEVSAPLCKFDLFANGEYFEKKGHLRGGCSGNSRLQVFDISLGLKTRHCFCSNWQLYGGIGVVIGQANLKNHTRCQGTFKQHSFAVGGVLKSGIQYFVSHCAYIDLFADYVYLPTRFKHRTVDLGGVRVGVGIGFKR